MVVHAPVSMPVACGMTHVEDLRGVVAMPAIPAMVTIPVPVHVWVLEEAAALVVGIGFTFLIYQYGCFDLRPD